MSQLYSDLTDQDYSTRPKKPVFLPPQESSFGIHPKALQSLSIMLAVVCVFCLFAAGILWRTLSLEQTAHQKLKGQFEDLEKKAVLLESEAKNYGTEAKNLEISLRELGAERERVANDLDDREAEVRILQRRLKTVQSQVAELKAANAEAQAQTLGAVSDGSLPETAFNDQNRAAGGFGREALVLSVNQKFQFVIVNLGLADNIKIGDQFWLDRDGNRSGLVEVEKLYDHFSAATILRQPKGKPIDANETLRQVV